MSTILADPTEMIRQGAPHLIHSEEQLAAYTQALFDLTAKPETTPHEQEAIALLTLLIDQYESRRSPISDAGPIDVLRLLLDQNHLTPSDLVPELGSETTVALILSGQAELTRDQVARLSQRFHVSPAVFLPRA